MIKGKMVCTLHGIIKKQVMKIYGKDYKIEYSYGKMLSVILTVHAITPEQAIAKAKEEVAGVYGRYLASKHTYKIKN